MKPYTVLLLYPDYLTGDYGTETYLAWTRARNPVEAIENAQRDLARQYSVRPNEKDFVPLSVFEGHLEDVNPSGVKND